MFIHTFEVCDTVSHDTYYEIQKTLKKDKTKWMAEKNGMLYFGLSDQGIKIRTFILHKKEFHTYKIQYIISARRVMENGNFVGLFDSYDYDELKEKVNAILRSKSPLMPKLNKCNLNRLDLCINAQFENQEQVKAYIRTARRADIPKNMVRYEVYDKTAKRYKPTKDDMTIHSECSFDNVEISIYNKYAQMKKQKDDYYPDQELDHARGIVRIEIRCKSEKIKELKKKYKIDKLGEFMKKADKIGKDLFEYYLPRMFGGSTIRTLKDAKERIANSNYKPHNKELLTEFIEASHMGRSAADVFSACDKATRKQIKFLLKELDINYVTATKEDVALFEDKYIPTPMKLFEQYRH